MKHTISVIVDNRPGVLARIAGLFSRRGYNIDSLAVGPAEDLAISRMTIVIHGDDRVLEQITKQLNKLVDVKKVIDLTAQPHLERETVLVKVQANNKTTPEIMNIVKAFRVKIVDVGLSSMIIEITGDSGKISALSSLLEKFGIIEVVRSGKIGLTRGKK